MINEDVPTVEEAASPTPMARKSYAWYKVTDPVTLATFFRIGDV